MANDLIHSAYVINEASVRTQNDEVQRVSRLVNVEVLAEWFLGEGMQAPATYLVPSTSSDSHLYPL